MADDTQAAVEGLGPNPQPLRKVVYTAIFGSYDILEPLESVPEEWECKCFSDKALSVQGWDNVVISQAELEATPRRSARKIKALSHRYVPDAEVTLWLDGNFGVRCELNQTVKEALDGYDIATFAHPDRDCLYDEAEKILSLGLDSFEIVRAQMERYRTAGYPSHAGLICSCVLLRRHTARVRRVNELWWREILNGSHRDQLSFNYVAMTLGVPYYVLEKAHINSLRFPSRPHRPWLERRLTAVEEIIKLIPHGSTFILVDNDEWGTTEVATERRHVPFLERDGHYWGPPEDDATAIGETVRLRHAGAEFMVFAWPAFWWLDYYAELHRYLRATSRCVLENDRLVAFDLRP